VANRNSQVRTRVRFRSPWDGGIRLNAKSDRRLCGYAAIWSIRMVSGYLLMAQVTPLRIAILHWNRTSSGPRRGARRMLAGGTPWRSWHTGWSGGLLDINFSQPAAATITRDKRISDLTGKRHAPGPDAASRSGNSLLTVTAFRRLVCERSLRPSPPSSIPCWKFCWRDRGLSADEKSLPSSTAANLRAGHRLTVFNSRPPERCFPPPCRNYFRRRVSGTRREQAIMTPDPTYEHT